LFLKHYFNIIVFTLLGLRGKKQVRDKSLDNKNAFLCENWFVRHSMSFNFTDDCMSLTFELNSNLHRFRDKNLRGQWRF